MNLNNGKDLKRLRVTIQGNVQGFGFRPTIYKLAQSLHLTGWVSNVGKGLEMEVEGASEQIDFFLSELTEQRPKEAVVISEKILQINCLGTLWFELLPSDLREISS